MLSVGGEGRAFVDVLGGEVRARRLDLVPAARREEVRAPLEERGRVPFGREDFQRRDAAGRASAGSPASACFAAWLVMPFTCLL